MQPFFFCEGESEEAYVNLLKSHYRLPSIQINAKVGSNNIDNEFIQKYKQDKPTHEKDQDFLMYDLDVKGIRERLKKVSDTILLLSNPCLELWFLLHFKKQTGQIKSKDCCDELSKRNRNYKKGIMDKVLREKLIAKKDQAIARAKVLNSPQNPSSTIYKFLDVLDGLKK
ncbi:RloB domain-containing protein [Echinicola strongylocentroti]|uniref:RloB domain-containing protein n=1 Tax=Echinicola strongylocentroti TaxID=1795355 RepID=A0A2Z4IGC7_9BACT|nr:RloB domain-containing protein [Echinicola strongylocentroti]